MKASRPAIIVGAVAALLTCTGSVWSNSAIGSLFGDAFLSWGIIIASTPFGGLHNAPPVYLVFAIGAILNALLWGGVALAIVSLVQRIRLRRQHWHTL